MLWFERQVVARLTGSTDQRRRAAVERYVDETLHVMPEHLRVAISAASVALGGLARISGGKVDVDWLDRSSLPPIRQYVRVFRSLVLFAEEELPAT
jgi:hypothetical protein